MKIKAHAKINLMLNIIGKRPDGYHEVDMIMQNIDFGDYIYVEKILNGIEINGTGALAYDETNLAYKAARLFFDVTGIRGGAKIYVEKNIPMCAGMAGGSTDAAAVLKGLNILYGKPLGKNVLLKISSRLGADVPFCIMGSTARAQGIGEIITPIEFFGKVHVVVVKPEVSVSTPEAYGSLNYDTMPHPDTECGVSALMNGNRNTLYKLMGNSFEQSIFNRYPEIGEIKQRFINCGADGALMSGSGSTVFGIFEDEFKAKCAYEEFKKEYTDTFLTCTVNE